MVKNNSNDIGHGLSLQTDMMMKAQIGSNGIDELWLSEIKDELSAAHSKIEANRGKGMQGWMHLPADKYNIVDDILKTAKNVREKFSAFVIFGIGGSALGPIAVHQALNHMHYNQLPDCKRNGPKFYVEDNVDPERMAALLDIIDPATTCFNIITKSGNTAETNVQFLFAVKALQDAGIEDISSHIIVTTNQPDGKKNNSLLDAARKMGLKTFYIPKGVGGRFSELSAVGLLAAAVCGIDIKQLLGGAHEMDEICRVNADIENNPALEFAAISYLAYTRLNKTITVIMPYADSLKYIADWFAQLWAESLGKVKVNADGTTQCVGQTPVKALGVTDQHSQLQLYTEGPNDKIVTFIGVEEYRTAMPIPRVDIPLEHAEFFSAFDMQTLIKGEQIGTEYSIYEKQRMHQLITLSKVDAFMIGQLLYFFEMATAYAGALLNINAFNQPGVEMSKKATMAYLKESDDDLGKAIKRFISRRGMPADK